MAREDLDVDSHCLPGVGREMGEEGATSLSGISEGIEFCGDVDDELGDHFKGDGQKPLLWGTGFRFLSYGTCNI